MNIENLKIDDIKPYVKNAKKHDERQIKNVMESIRQFGFAQPLVVDKDNVLIIGHCRLIAAKRLKHKTVPVLRMDDLSPEQVDKLRLLDNKLNESEWDMDLLADEVPDLDWDGFDIDFFLDDWFNREKEGEQRQEGNDEYNEFLDKFENKKTTDDCYTPDNIYNAVADWVAKEFNLNKASFVRPFYPGGNYQEENYTEKSVVVDNPPFSIMAEILRWYTERKINFFLFAPSLTILTATDCNLTYITTGAQVTYENGANVSTGFITNLDDEYRLRTAPDLWEAIKEQNDINLRERTKELPNYEYPDNVICPAQIMKIAHYGQDLRIKKKDCIIISELDEQKAEGKALFGKGLLLAEKAAAEKAAVRKWQLSAREKEIVRKLGENE